MLKIADMKQTAKEIIAEESEKNNIDVSLFSCCTLEYYNSAFFKESLKKDRSLFLRPFTTNGFAVFQEQTPMIVLFPGHRVRDELFGSQYQQVEYLKTIYHEFRHIIQWEYSDDENFTYENYIKLFEYLLTHAGRYYEQNHDNFFIEIDADLYGINMAYDFLKRKNMLTPEIEKYIYLRKNQYEYRYNNFNIQFMLKKFNRIIKKKNISKYCELPMLNIFYDEFGNYRNINDILSNENFDKVDKRIVYTIFSNEEFLQIQDLDNINESGLKIIIESIEYTKNSLKVQQEKNNEYLKKCIISEKEFLKSKQSLYDYINSLNRMSVLFLNKFKDSFLNKESSNINNIYDNLEELNRRMGK